MNILNETHSVIKTVIEDAVQHDIWNEFYSIDNATVMTVAYTMCGSIKLQHNIELLLKEHKY